MEFPISSTLMELHEDLAGIQPNEAVPPNEAHTKSATRVSAPPLGGESHLIVIPYPPPLAVGSRAVIRQPKIPPALWRVVELDDSRRSFTWVNSAPGVRVVAKHSVVSVGKRSRVKLSLRFEGLFSGILGFVTRKLNNRYLATEVQGLKSRVEGLNVGR